MSSFFPSSRGSLRVATTVPMMRARTMIDDYFVLLPIGSRSGVRRGFHGSHVTANHGGHVAGSDLLPSDEVHLRGLHHCVRGFYHRNQAARFDHPQSLTHCRFYCHALLLLISGHFKVETTRSIKSISSLRVREIVSDSPSVTGHIGSFGWASDSSRP